MNQKQRLLAHMQAGHVVESITAYEKFGVCCLRARIHELRSELHKIRGREFLINGKWITLYFMKARKYKRYGVNE